MKLLPASRWVPALLLIVVAKLVSACATNDENLSERPWNTPRSWENGLPSGLTEERR